MKIVVNINNSRIEGGKTQMVSNIRYTEKAQLTLV